MVCTRCAGPVTTAGSFCSTCGLPIPRIESTQPSYTRLALLWTFAAFAAIIVILGLLGHNKLLAPVRQDAVAPGAPGYSDSHAEYRTPTVSLGDYFRIHEGMSYDQVCEIIGSDGTEVGRSDIAGHTTVMYSWKNWTGSNMNAMFQNDRLVTKAQFGLR
jgi:hypothetical protein